MKNRALFKFSNFSLKQKMVLEWWCEGSPYADKDGIICDGSIRAGKTTAMAFSFIMWSMDTFCDENFAMCGKTINSLRRNVLKQLKRILISRGYTYTEHRSENYITITLGDVSNDYYLFGGKDEASQDLIQGITLAGIFFDEVALMPESFVNQAVGRCSVEGSKFWFNCNPDSPNHYFKKNWIDKLTEKNLIRIHFTMDDNPSLSEKTIKRYKSLFTGIFFDRFILGLWVMAEGLIFPNFKQALGKCPFVLNEKTFHKMDDFCLSIDYGTLNAFACALWVKVGDIWWMWRRYYYSGRETGVQLTDAQYADKVCELVLPLFEIQKTKAEMGLCTPDKITTIIDPSAASFITELKLRKIFRTKHADNNVKDGIRHTNTAIYQGVIKVDEGIEEFSNEASSYVYDEKENPVKENDHLMDATRYFVETKKLGRVKLTENGDYEKLLSNDGMGGSALNSYF